MRDLTLRNMETRYSDVSRYPGFGLLVSEGFELGIATSDIVLQGELLSIKPAGITRCSSSN